MADQRETAVGVFQDRAQADRAVRELKQAGFSDNEIGYTTPNKDEAGGVETGDGGVGHSGGHVLGGAVAGGGVGGTPGALAAGLIPGIGPIIAGGILAVTAAGAGLGAAGGSLIGALTGLGVPEDEAHYYEGEARSGRTLVTVKSGSRYEEARSILQGAGAYDMQSRPEFETAQSSDAQRMPLMEEKLTPRKETVETGNVKLRKEVVTEQRQMDVPVKHEEVVLERHPVEPREAQGASIGEGEVRVPLREEKVRVEKQPYVKEEVSVGKRPVEETQTITGDVRREEPRIENNPQR